ncbi:hypothetical protein ACFUGD_01150 [Streptomyces sp. NPDC057217]|uniref:hypothetical protein n=1 Tax=Streptomyces sp. NPDC057217 TaxID=3346054 RepID=UPI00363A7572
MQTITVTATELYRNDSVRLFKGEMPYLVDSVSGLPGGRVSVTFSSGDVAEYAATDEVTVYDNDLWDDVVYN